jgi:Family of unknown function (DUF5662)
MKKNEFKVLNQFTGEDVVFVAGQRVIYLNHKLGTISKDGKLLLDDGRVFDEVVFEQPHKLTPTNIPFNSEADTRKHIADVSNGLMVAASELLNRAKNHDLSKLGEIEKPIFDKETPMLASLEFGSDEYKQSLDNLGIALAHHYENNSHHPQHYKEGVFGMDLYDLIEMLIDWDAAGKRTKNGDIHASLIINAKRFEIPDSIVVILKNHINRYIKNEK